MGIRRSFGGRVFDIVDVFLLLCLVVVTLYPFLHVLVASLSHPFLLMAHQGFLLWPLGGATLGSYRMVLSNPLILSGYLNTLFIVIVGTAINFVLTCLAAFVLSRKGLMWGKAIMFFIALTMFVNGGMIPFFLVVKGVGLYDSIWAMIIPYAVSTFNIIIVRTSFQGIPDEIEESAKIDGAMDITVLFKLIIPMSMPVIAVIVLFNVVAFWNSWFSAVLFIRRSELYPLQLVLRQMLVLGDVSFMAKGVIGEAQQYVMTIKYGAIIVAAVPILVFYPFLQRYFAKGVMIGALKY